MRKFRANFSYFPHKKNLTYSIQIDCITELFGQLFFFIYLQIGSSLQRMSQSPVNLNQVAKPSIKEGIMDAIKIGVPGVFNLPQMKSGSNDSHIRWTLIGLEDQLWGKSVALSGR